MFLPWRRVAGPSESFHVVVQRAEGYLADFEPEVLMLGAMPDSMFPRVVKKTIQRALRRFGVDMVRWNVQSSSKVALARMLTHHHVDTILDVGANRGQYALLLRELGYRGRIVSFEPLTGPHRSLERSAQRDPLWIIAPRTALGNEEGEIRINVASNEGASSSILPMLDAHRRAAPEATYVASEVVPISRLDRIAEEFLGQSTRIFVKMDVQGYELQVLQGATQLLPRIVGAQLEASLVPLYAGQALLPELIEWMRTQGYDMWGIMPSFADCWNGRLLQADLTFFRG